MTTDLKFETVSDINDGIKISGSFPHGQVRLGDTVFDVWATREDHVGLTTASGSAFQDPHSADDDGTSYAYSVNRVPYTVRLDVSWIDQSFGGKWLPDFIIRRQDRFDGPSSAARKFFHDKFAPAFIEWVQSDDFALMLRDFAARQRAEKNLAAARKRVEDARAELAEAEAELAAAGVSV